MKAPLLLTLLATVFAGCDDDDATPKDATPKDATVTDAAPRSDAGTTAGATKTYKAEVWADNWSAMYIGTREVMQDSVSINTERSFNAEVFEFEAARPFLINVVMKDYIANDSGLEYIGERNQQMGDGGYIAQISDAATGATVAVSDARWKCLTIHTAPLDKSCESAADPLTECTQHGATRPCTRRRRSAPRTATTRSPGIRRPPSSGALTSRPTTRSSAARG